MIAMIWLGVNNLSLEHQNGIGKNELCLPQNVMSQIQREMVQDMISHSRPTIQQTE